ncbi:DUF4181 domain-containing protein [Virgibacillus doumboii]|uniref:DUF4181 domain-containing protein n=1 Tax=Virgibacillus doumboii TaxID=2697503 RepID=UPI0013E0ABCF|nr:DUF4181 domain-containing protein [Virgibacillus doumboii]
MHPSYGPGPEFWGNLVILGATLLLVFFIFNTIMRKILRVERKKLFSQNHVNESHKKIDRYIWIASILTIIVSYFIFLFNYHNHYLIENYQWIFLAIGVVSALLQEAVRAVMEWKYKKGK